MIKTMGYGDPTVGYLSALPNLAGVVGMLLFSRSSDRTGERVWHVALPCLPGSAGLVGAGSTLAVDPLLALAFFCLAGVGISGSLPTFWNLPTAWLGPTAAAGGIAVINSIGNISGYVAPQMVGCCATRPAATRCRWSPPASACWRPPPASCCRPASRTGRSWQPGRGAGDRAALTQRGRCFSFAPDQGS